MYYNIDHKKKISWITSIQIEKSIFFSKIIRVLPLVITFHHSIAILFIWHATLSHRELLIGAITLFYTLDRFSLSHFEALCRALWARCFFNGIFLESGFFPLLIKWFRVSNGWDVVTCNYPRHESHCIDWCSFYTFFPCYEFYFQFQ